MSTADTYLTTSGPATAVQGLPEEVVAMLFGRFSRNPRPFRETLQDMIDKGHLDPPAWNPTDMSERVRKFHERITIGYGHKSVADHASVHFCLEGVSAVAERDWTSARLIAASSKSTRYVDFRDAGFVVPDNWPPHMRSEYEAHCEDLLSSYEKLVPMAEVAVRHIVPYDDEAKQSWKKQEGWERATSKRALDMVRDLLPMSVRTSFGITCSATALREMLDKREHDATPEARYTAKHVRTACRSVVPTLLPKESRDIPRHPMPTPPWSSQRVNVPMKVELIGKPSWPAVERVTGMRATNLVSRWLYDRARHMVPDRTAESAMYTFVLTMPMAIHRDLGRHRMMTQLRTFLTPAMGYGIDPLLGDHTMHRHYARLAMLAAAHTEALQRADARLQSWVGDVCESALQYACPLATNVRVTWVVNLRELIHVLGLRTTPQGHPSYRRLVQMVARAVRKGDPMTRSIVDDVTNFERVFVGRPG